MWKESLCETTGDVLSVSTKDMNSLQATIALQAECLSSFRNH